MKLVGNIKPFPLSKYKQGALAPVELASVNLGDIASESIEERLCQPLTELLKQSGYGLRHCPRWQEPSLNAVKGSVAPHRDPGLGLVAFWLLHKQPWRKMKEDDQAKWYVEDPWLFTARQSRQVEVGDIIIFNASDIHSWLCNGGIYAISQTIYRKSRQ
jgi:hypothetical protein